MHRDVGGAFEQGGFQFLDEQALAADLRQRCVEQLVAATGHRQQGDGQAGMRLFQARLDVFGLPQGEALWRVAMRISRDDMGYSVHRDAPMITVRTRVRGRWAR